MRHLPAMHAASTLHQHRLRLYRVVQPHPDCACIATYELTTHGDDTFKHLPIKTLATINNYVRQQTTTGIKVIPGNNTKVGPHTHILQLSYLQPLLI